jgi:quercetin dioxygenase-like cupin family protein
MTKKQFAAIASVAVIAVLILVLNVLPASGGSGDPPPEPIATEFLTDRAVFPDRTTLKVRVLRDDEWEIVRIRRPSRTVTARFTIQPEVEFPWHSHRGPVVVNVVEGELTYVDADNCDGTTYPAGTAFFDLGKGHVHSAFNPDDDDVTVIVATFFKAPAEGPLLIPAPPGCP